MMENKKLTGMIGADKPHLSGNVPVKSGSLKTEDNWLNSREAAEYLRVSVPTLRNLTSNGTVPFYKFGRRNRYLRCELRELLLANPKGVRNGD